MSNQASHEIKSFRMEKLKMIILRNIQNVKRMNEPHEGVATHLVGLVGIARIILLKMVIDNVWSHRICGDCCCGGQKAFSFSCLEGFNVFITVFNKFWSLLRRIVVDVVFAAKETMEKVLNRLLAPDGCLESIRSFREIQNNSTSANTPSLTWKFSACRPFLHSSSSPQPLPRRHLHCCCFDSKYQKQNSTPSFRFHSRCYLNCTQNLTASFLRRRIWRAGTSSRNSVGSPARRCAGHPEQQSAATGPGLRCFCFSCNRRARDLAVDWIIYGKRPFEGV